MLLAPLPGRHTAEIARITLTQVIATPPLELRKSITWDRGSETAQNARFETETGIRIYFCDPQSPRGSLQQLLEYAVEGSVGAFV